MEKIRKLLDLTGKVAIVTGGAIGIGFGISYRLAEAGATVVIANRTKEEGESAAAKLRKKKFNVIAIQTDVSDENSVKELVEQVIKRYKRIDILVNNAGIYPEIPLLKMGLADFERV
ncbi:MAG: SDR family NAD(P)-dependent oxidoreductase, partial [Candidatus Micrarchaeaceae archaeon]